MNTQAVKVLFISGWGRSGSTILSRMLGQIPGFLSVGELRFVWDRGLLRNLSCACGMRFRECTLWSRVVSHLGLASEQEVQRFLDIRDRFRTRDCISSRLPVKDRVSKEEFKDYTEALGKIYEGLRDATGCRVIVDSSKFPSHGYFLDSTPGIDLHVVHLMRDPRAVAFSWRRRKLYDPMGQGSQYMRRHGVAQSALYWMAWNGVTEYLWASRGRRYLQVRYEQFVRHPLHSVQRIVDFLGEPAELTFFTDPHTAILGPTHELSGNPSRFETGRVEIRADQEWREKMPLSDRLLVSILTSPLLFRYGYSRA